MGLGARETGYGASAISQLVPFRFQTAVVALRPSRVKSSFNSKMSAHLCRQRESDADMMIVEKKSDEGRSSLGNGIFFFHDDHKLLLFESSL